MKHPQPALATLAALVLALTPALAEDGRALIDKDLNNGGFEDATLQPWSPDLKEGFAIAASKNLVKDGAQSCKVTLIGKSSERSGSRLEQEIKDIALSDGKNFILKFDAATAGANPAPAIAGELVLFEGTEFVGSLPLASIVTPNEDWENFEVEFSGDIPESWTGDRAQLRIAFFVDGGADNLPYELVLDNVRLIQKH